MESFDCFGKGNPTAGGKAGVGFLVQKVTDSLGVADCGRRGFFMGWVGLLGLPGGGRPFGGRTDVGRRFVGRTGSGSGLELGQGLV